MNREYAKYILKEIKSIHFYELRVKELNDQLIDIKEEIHDLQWPSSPSIGDVRITTIKPKSSRVNELLDEENEILKEKQKFETRLQDSRAFLLKLKLVCSNEEYELVESYRRGYSYTQIENKYHVSNAYRALISYISRLE